MKFPHPIPVKELAQKLGAKLIGDESLQATGINEIHKVESGDITFVDARKYFKKSFKFIYLMFKLFLISSCY